MVHPFSKGNSKVRHVNTRYKTFSVEGRQFCARFVYILYQTLFSRFSGIFHSGITAMNIVKEMGKSVMFYCLNDDVVCRYYSNEREREREY